MHVHRVMKLLLTVAPAASLACMPGCEEAPPAAPAAQSPGNGSGHSDGHAHTPGDGHDHEHANGHSHGPKTELGSQTVGGFTIAAVQEGSVTPGGEATFDITISGGPSPAAVRMWIGSQDAKGAVKAKAGKEGAAWHAHVEVPKPLEPPSRVWVEIEVEGGAKQSAGFDLKT